MMRSHSDNFTSTLEARNLRRSGFSLTELLVVIGLIILMLALAMPAFNFMTGSTSIEGTGNTLSAVFSRVRQDAIGRQADRGVVIYRDVDQDRLVAVLVEYKPVPTTHAMLTFYHVGDYVLYSGEYYVCLEPHSGEQPNLSPNYWRKLQGMLAAEMGAIYAYYPPIDVVSGVDQIYLPKVADVRGIGGKTPSSPTPENFCYPAVFIFDSKGQLVHRRYTLFVNGIAATASGIGSPGGAQILGITPIGPTQLINTSQLGITVFNADEGKNQAGNLNNWLTENGRPYLINRYNGTLMKGE